MINSSARRYPSTALGPRHARPAPHQLSAARAAVLRAVISAGEAVTVVALADRLGQHPNTVREHLDALVAAGRTERLRSTPVGRGRPAWLYRAVGPADAAAGEGDDADVVTGGEEYAALALALIDEVSRSDPDPRRVARQAGERWGRTLADRRAAARAGAVDRAEPDRAEPAGAEPDRAEPDRVGPDRTVPDETGAPASADGVDESGAAASAAAPQDNGGDGPSAESGPAGGADPAGVVVDMLAGLRFEPQPAAQPGRIRLTTCPLLDAARRNPDVVCEVHLGIVRGALDRLGADPDGADLVPFAEPGACLLTLPGPR